MNTEIIPEITENQKRNKPTRAAYERRANRRASLRFVAQRIQFFGRDAYRAGRDALGLRDDVSLFELNTDDLAALGRAIGEVIL